MAELSTLARPYARAAFELARGEKTFPAWSAFLGLEALAATDPRVQRLIGHPKVERSELADFLLGLHKTKPSADQANFIRVLADNDRLALLPAIAELFDGYRADAENTIAAHVRAAVALSEEQESRLVKALEKRFSRQVQLDVVTDKALLGGAVIRSGDTVIDGSVKLRLAALARAIRH